MPTPTEIDRYIIAARLKGYLNDHEAAVALLTKAVEKHPEDVRLRRFRGHRRISIRDIAGAIDDFRFAADRIETVPDGYELYQHEVVKDIDALLLGNDEAVREQFLPMSDAHGQEHIYDTTLHAAIWYHYGVALYLDGQLQECIDVFERSFAASFHAEGLVASLDWLYMIHRRLRNETAAGEVLTRFANLSEVDESDPGYTERMRLYRGERSPEDLLGASTDRDLVNATLLYGVGNWLHYNGRELEAREVFRRVLESHSPYSFAHIAAEVELSDSALARI